jgi:8-oxo-dGDP phosphatase
MAREPSMHGARTQWSVYGSRSIYRSRWIDVQLVDVESPDGERFEHHVVRMQRVAVAVVLNEPGSRVLMLRRHRFIDDSWGWEVPVGIVEPDEAPASAAAREVEEETGWRPGPLVHALTFQPAIGIADSPHDLFVGTGADHIGTPTDLTEAEEVAWIPVENLLAMSNRGSIRDGATLIGVLHLLASHPRP